MADFYPLVKFQLKSPCTALGCASCNCRTLFLLLHGAHYTPFLSAHYFPPWSCIMRTENISIGDSAISLWPVYTVTKRVHIQKDLVPILMYSGHCIEIWTLAFHLLLAWGPGSHTADWTSLVPCVLDVWSVTGIGQSKVATFYLVKLKKHVVISFPSLWFSNDKGSLKH